MNPKQIKELEEWMLRESRNDFLKFLAGTIIVGVAGFLILKWLGA